MFGTVFSNPYRTLILKLLARYPTRTSRHSQSLCRHACVYGLWDTCYGKVSEVSRHTPARFSFPFGTLRLYFLTFGANVKGLQLVVKCCAGAPFFWEFGSAHHPQNYMCLPHMCFRPLHLFSPRSKKKSADLNSPKAILGGGLFSP